MSNRTFYLFKRTPFPTLTKVILRKKLFSTLPAFLGTPVLAILNRMQLTTFSHESALVAN